MKIIALNPPFLPRYSRESRSPAVTKSGTLYYPMWLAYAVGYLEKQGHDVMLLDAPATGAGTEEIVEQAATFRPDLAVLGTSTPSIYNDVRVLEALKQRLPALFGILVGVHVSALPEKTLELSRSIDAIAVGEYEETIGELAGAGVDRLKVKDIRDIKGLVFRMSDNSFTRSEPRPHIQNLDDLPFVSAVYRKHLRIGDYFYGHSRHPIVVLVTGRGCPFRCTYCVIPQTIQGHAYRKRSIENVVKEFGYIADTLPQTREIMIEDDTFTADKKRCRNLAQALIDAGYTKIPWSANARADVDYQTMRLMKRAGCRLFCVGFESGDQRILDAIRKDTTLERIRRFMRDARRAGILIHGCFMVGNRGETRETLETTLKFAKELSPDTAQFYPIMVYPGTDDYRYFKEKKWFVTDDFRKWLTDDGLHSSVVSNPELPYEELVAFCARARREFYLRPGYVVRKMWQSLRDPAEGKRNIKAARTFMRYLLTPERSTG